VSIEAAQKHLGLARKQCDRATTDSWDPADAASCVTNVFYSYENLIVAVAEAHASAFCASQRFTTTSELKAQ
jgi:hypothetical protein